MKTRLQAAYADGDIEVVDLTGTQDHWQVFVRSKAFSGLNRVRQHKSVMDVFAAELQTGEVHALSIKTEAKD
jgi:stress-induced morphogen